MVIDLILAHPDPDSFNSAIARTAKETLEAAGHQVYFHDLYAEDFDPRLPAEEIPIDADLPPQVAEHCRHLSTADGIIIVHPNWWGQPPALLKGWIDRVIRPGTAYEFLEGDGGEGVPRGLLKAHTALILNTANTPKEREMDVFGDPLERIWRDCVFGLCGVDIFMRRIFRVMVMSTAEQRTAWLEEVKNLVNRHFPPVQPGGKP